MLLAYPESGTGGDLHWGRATLSASNVAQLRAGLSAPAGAEIASLLDFRPAYSGAVFRLTAGRGPLEDLARSFPALLFALATGYGTAERRQRCIDAVLAGTGLREAAGMLELPMWLRRLPPQAFAEPLPPLPNDPDFSSRIASIMPDAHALAAGWLSRVLYGLRAGHAEFALWAARQPHFDRRRTPDDPFHMMAAFAWHSSRPESFGHRLIRRPWSPDMSVRRVVEETILWQRRMDLALCLGKGVRDTWCMEGEAHGYSFVPLRTVEDYLAESVAMSNCLDTYADHLRSGTNRVFSIRKNGRRVADIEIGQHEEEATMPTIVQLRGIRNRRAGPDVWQAAYAWLGSQMLRPFTPRMARQALGSRLSARKLVWGAYLDHLATWHLDSRFKACLAQRFSPRYATRRAVVFRDDASCF